MGYMSALDMNEQAGCNYQTMNWHLNCNHWPPNKFNDDMVYFALKAVKYANQGKYRTQIKLPTGRSYHGKRMVPVYVVIESLHLDAFINYQEEE